MAQTNYTPISLYYSTTASAAPTAGNLVNGELAINITDGKLYYKDNTGTVKVIAGTGGTGVVAGSNTQIQFNNNGVFGASSGMTWDGTNLTASQLRSSGLTSGRVTYAGASGLLQDSASLTFNGTTLTAGGLTTTGTTSTGVLSVTGNTTLGDASADSLTVNATITSNLIFTDNTYDIGASGATRPRSIYLAGNATTGGSVNVGTALLVNTATQYGQASVYSTTTYSPAGGVIVAATNNSSTGQNIASFWNNHASVNTELDFGSAAQFVPSIQARVYSNGATTSLALNPSGGYVGINGVTSPGGALEIFQTSTTVPNLRLRYNSTSYFADHILAPGGQYTIYSPPANGVTSGDILIRAGSNIQFATNNNTYSAYQMSLDTSGRLLVNSNSAIYTNSKIQATASSGPTLGIQQTTNTEYVAGFWNSSATAARKLVAFFYGAGGSQHGSIESTGTTMLYYGAGGSGISIDSSGNVGIGNTSPSGRLDVTGRTYIRASGSDTVLTLINQSGGDGSISATGTSNTMNYGFSTYSTSNALYIQNAGGIGINTNNPGGYSGRFVAVNNSTYPNTYAVYKNDTSQSILSLAYEGGTSFTNGYKAGVNFASDQVPNGSYAAQNKWFVGIYATADGVGNARLAFYDQKNGVERMNLNMSGQLMVGVGPNNGQSYFVGMYKGSSDVQLLINSDNGYNAYINFAGFSGGLSYGRDGGTGYFRWNNAVNLGGSQIMTLTDDSYLLLGTTSKSGDISNYAPAVVGQVMTRQVVFGATNSGVNCDVTGITIGSYLITVTSVGTYHSRATYWVGAYDTADYGYQSLGSSGYGAAQTVTVIGVGYNNITFRVSFGNNVSGVTINILRLGS